MLQIDPGEIAELGTQVASFGAIGMGEVSVDQLFELIVGIVLLVAEISP